jgi:hypothetical protein
LGPACEFSFGTRYLRRADQDPLTGAAGESLCPSHPPQGGVPAVAVFKAMLIGLHALREERGEFVAAWHCEFRFDLASTIVPLEIGLRGAWLGPTRGATGEQKPEQRR